jgi:hypothetical protein
MGGIRPDRLEPWHKDREPAEHLRPLTITALANRHFAIIEELEDA